MTPKQKQGAIAYAKAHHLPPRLAFDAVHWALKNNMEKADEVLGTFGVESVTCEDDEMQYLNTGDTYEITLCRNDCGEVFWAAWGEWLEESENDLHDNENSIYCGHCGQCTPRDGKGSDICTVVCEHCGRLVVSGEEPPPRGIMFFKEG